MTISVEQTDSTTADAEQPAPPASRQRGGLNAKQLTAVLALVGAGAAMLLAAFTAGGAGSATVCEQELRAQARAIMAWHDNSGGETPRGCTGMDKAEVDRMAGQIYGKAFAG